jgi:hypothetical protein
LRYGHRAGDDQAFAPVASATTKRSRGGDDKGRAGCGEAPRAIAHIGCLFSVLVDHTALSFFGTSPDSIIYILRRELKP